MFVFTVTEMGKFASPPLHTSPPELPAVPAEKENIHLLKSIVSSKMSSKGGM